MANNLSPRSLDTHSLADVRGLLFYVPCHVTSSILWPNITSIDWGSTSIFTSTPISITELLWHRTDMLIYINHKGITRNLKWHIPLIEWWFRKLDWPSVSLGNRSNTCFACTRKSKNPDRQPFRLQSWWHGKWVETEITTRNVCRYLFDISHAKMITPKLDCIHKQK